MGYNVKKHIEKSVERLGGEGYTLEKVFQRIDYEWQGDYEGRALLAFGNLNNITDGDFNRDKVLFDAIPSRLNSHGYMGLIMTDIEEQRLAGHSWFLRGLLEYFVNHNDKKALDIAKGIIDNLYLPIISKLNLYELSKNKVIGGVSGNNTSSVNGWVYSSDVGCLFISIDGLSEYYVITKDQNVLKLLNMLIDKYVELDFIGDKVQTHATLTALRGILKLYNLTKEQKYLDIVKKIFNLYIDYGMTLTYSNFNWFDRKDTWTEPCAVVDSLIIAISLYKITNDEKYKTLARRICFNGLTHAHRINGGAGPDSCVTKENPIFKILMYEAHFCCTMRYCEGLKYIYYNQDLFNEDGTIVKLEDGRVLIGDTLKLIDIKTNKEIILSDIEFPKEDGSEYKLILK